MVCLTRSERPEKGDGEAHASVNPDYKQLSALHGECETGAPSKCALSSLSKGRETDSQIVQQLLHFALLRLRMGWLGRLTRAVGRWHRQRRMEFRTINVVERHSSCECGQVVLAYLCES